MGLRGVTTKLLRLFDSGIFGIGVKGSGSGF